MFMFCVCNVFRSMKEENLIKKLHQIVKEEKSLKAIEKKGLQIFFKKRGMRKILLKDNKKVHEELER